MTNLLFFRWKSFYLQCGDDGRHSTINLSREYIGLIADFMAWRVSRMIALTSILSDSASEVCVGLTLLNGLSGLMRCVYRSLTNQRSITAAAIAESSTELYKSMQSGDSAMRRGRISTQRRRHTGHRRRREE